MALVLSVSKRFWDRLLFNVARSFESLVFSLISQTAVKKIMTFPVLKPSSLRVFFFVSACSGLLFSPLRMVFAQDLKNSKEETKIADFGTIKFALPISYLPIVAPKTGNSRGAFWIHLLLPKFNPAATDLEANRAVGTGRKLRVFYSYGGKIRDQTEILSFFLKSGGVDPSKYVTEKNGCHLFRAQMTAVRELHACYLKSETILIFCGVIEEVPFPACEVTKNVEGGWISYTYSKEFLGSSLEIDENVSKLIHSFVL